MVDVSAAFQRLQAVLDFPQEIGILVVINVPWQPLKVEALGCSHEWETW